jgi:hypothetical protein
MGWQQLWTRVMSRRKVGPADPLAKEVQTIRALHERAKRHAKELVDIVVDIGKHLTRAKKKLKLVGHGNWGTWLAENFEWSEDSAARYMKLYELIRSGKIKIRTVRNLPLAAGYALAGHEHLSQQFFDDLTRRVDAGERPTTQQLRVEIGTEVKTLVAPGYTLPPPKPLITPRTVAAPVYPPAKPSPVRTFSPPPWPHAFHRFLEAVVDIANVIDKPSARAFAEGVRAGEAPAGLDAGCLREVIGMLTEFVTELDGEADASPRHHRPRANAHAAGRRRRRRIG